MHFGQKLCTYIHYCACLFMLFANAVERHKAEYSKPFVCFEGLHEKLIFHFSCCKNLYLMSISELESCCGKQSPCPAIHERLRKQCEHLYLFSKYWITCSRNSIEQRCWNSTGHHQLRNRECIKPNSPCKTKFSQCICLTRNVYEISWFTSALPYEPHTRGAKGEGRLWLSHGRSQQR